MAMSEIDSFFWKFKKLLHSGKNAQLEIKSEAGKAVVKLTAEVDAFPPDHARFRNGPARQRRREKRAANRADAEKAAEPELVVNATEEEASVQHSNISAEEAPATANESKSALIAIEPRDEIENVALSSDTIADDEKKTKEICSVVSIIPVRVVSASDDAIEKTVKEKLEDKELKVLDTYIQRSVNGVFTRCDVKIEAVEGTQIDETNFQFINCRVIPLYGNS